MHVRNWEFVFEDTEQTLFSQGSTNTVLAFNEQHGQKGAVSDTRDSVVGTAVDKAAYRSELYNVVWLESLQILSVEA